MAAVTAFHGPQFRIPRWRPRAAGRRPQQRGAGYYVARPVYAGQAAPGPLHRARAVPGSRADPGGDDSDKGEREICFLLKHDLSIFHFMAADATGFGASD